VRTDFERAYVTALGPVAVLTLNHPEVMNAVGTRMLGGMMQALDFVEARRGQFRALVLTGEGRSFCTGANLSETREHREGPPDAGRILEQGFHPLLRRMRGLELPFLTAVNGAAAGIGMSLALMGDLILAGRSAYFLQAFARLGLVPDGGSTWLLPRLIGHARARELSMLAEKLPAETALSWGLINRLYDDDVLMTEALAMANRLAHGPTLALAATRHLYWASPHHAFEQQLDLERQFQRTAGQTEDFAEGLSAFLQKRDTQFKGK
jgi:2-(1,2-epoxy-1,2-dihydrophenyl)acetyl-CoA isomerase